MASRFSLMNEALSILGADPIEDDIFAATQGDLDDLSPDGLSRQYDDTASIVLSIYPGAKRKILSSHPWSFLEQRAALTGTGAAREPSWPFEYQYRQPESVGNIRAVFDTNDYQRHPRTGEWTAQGSFVYASFSPAWADYILTDIDEGLLPPLVEDALQSELTARLTMPLIQDSDTHRIHRMTADDALKLAKKMDGQAQPAAAFSGFGFVDAFFGGSYGENTAGFPTGPLTPYVP